jgi:hypothetical protein
MSDSTMKMLLLRIVAELRDREHGIFPVVGPIAIVDAEGILPNRAQLPFITITEGGIEHVPETNVEMALTLRFTVWVYQVLVTSPDATVMGAGAALGLLDLTQRVYDALNANLLSNNYLSLFCTAELPCEKVEIGGPDGEIVRLLFRRGLTFEATLELSEE